MNTSIMTKTASPVKSLQARFGTDIAAACAQVDEIEQLRNYAKVHRNRYERTGDMSDLRRALRLEAEAAGIAETFDARRRAR